MIFNRDGSVDRNYSINRMIETGKLHLFCRGQSIASSKNLKNLIEDGNNHRIDQSKKKYKIEYNPKPIPTNQFDWDWWHEDFDGAIDSVDDRCGTAPSRIQCLKRIEEIEVCPHI